MRLANLGGRAVLVVDGGTVDVGAASAGRFGPDPQGLFDDWPAFRAWAATASGDAAELDPASLDAPVPRPRQVIAIGVNYTGSKPQYSLGKSFTGFGPTGPWLVTPDELPDRDDLAIGCALDGEQLQSGRTAAMIYSVPVLIERLSAVLTLFPGDLIFTGTPAGVGNARTPKRFLHPGGVLVSSIEGVGELTTRFAAAAL